MNEETFINWERVIQIAQQTTPLKVITPKLRARTAFDAGFQSAQHLIVQALRNAQTDALKKNSNEETNQIFNQD